MSDFLSSIGSFFSGGGGKAVSSLGELGLTGAGLFGNIAANKQKQQLINELNNPSQLAQKATALAGNLNPALIQAVNNQVGGTLASQGLSQSPGIMATETSQALAPYVQQNYNTALSSVMQGIMAALQGSPNPSNLAPLLALLGKQGGTGGNPVTNAGSGPSAGTLLNTIWGDNSANSDNGAGGTYMDPGIVSGDPGLSA